MTEPKTFPAAVLYSLVTARPYCTSAEALAAMTHLFGFPLTPVAMTLPRLWDAAADAVGQEHPKLLTLEVPATLALAEPSPDPVHLQNLIDWFRAYGLGDLCLTPLPLGSVPEPTREELARAMFPPEVE